jgi:hypothetical protein
LELLDLAVDNFSGDTRNAKLPSRQPGLWDPVCYNNKHEGTCINARTLSEKRRKKYEASILELVAGDRERKRWNGCRGPNILGGSRPDGLLEA